MVDNYSSKNFEEAKNREVLSSDAPREVDKHSDDSYH